MSNMIIRTSSGEELSCGENGMQTAVIACAALLRFPWIELVEPDTGITSLWTAGERDERGTPRQIFIETGDDVQIVLNS